MPRRLVSLIRHAPGAPRGSEPSLEVNSYAVTQDLDLTVVLLSDAVRLAVAAVENPARMIAGAAFPESSASHDLQALLESGIHVLAHDDAVTDHGIDPDELLSGVTLASDSDIAVAVDRAEGVLTW